ncbi:MAG: hypothetical protein K0R60_1916 [Microbacterium sp.]|nr:hypothetical protein [Microbacterium sp.]
MPRATLTAWASSSASSSTRSRSGSSRSSRLTFPLYILTLGLFSLIVNGFLLWLTSWITEFWSWGLRVEGFWWGVVAALLISLMNWIFGLILRPKRSDD